MRRLLRRSSLVLLSAVAALSILFSLRGFLLADLISWGRYEFPDDGLFTYRGGWFESSFAGARFGYRRVGFYGLAGSWGVHGVDWSQVEPESYPYLYDYADDALDVHVRGLGFQLAALREGSSNGYHDEWSATLPLPFVAALTGMWPTLYARRAIRRYRSRVLRAAGRCTACGYDLQASIDRCPECGQRITSP
jgi:hypothetical protein